jgi:hypothetical protein
MRLALAPKAVKVVEEDEVVGNGVGDIISIKHDSNKKPAIARCIIIVVGRYG